MKSMQFSFIIQIAYNSNYINFFCLSIIPCCCFLNIIYGTIIVEFMKRNSWNSKIDKLVKLVACIFSDALLEIQ